MSHRVRDHRHRELQIVAEIVVNFDIGQRIPKRLRILEITDEIANAVCGCSQFENCSSVHVEKMTIDSPKVSGA